LVVEVVVRIMVLKGVMMVVEVMEIVLKTERR
jgi:hypothetical protein